MMTTDTKTDSGKSAACKIIKLLSDQKLGPEIGFSDPAYTDVRGYAYLNITVQFGQETAGEPPVDVSVMFAFDAKGKMATRHFLNLEENPGTTAQAPCVMDVSGLGTWHGAPHNVSRYLVRVPVMAPFFNVFLYNRAPGARTVSVWAYLGA
jgi:hypothetical protein